jgi:superoxide dismutase, Fe-Mn family
MFKLPHLPYEYGALEPYIDTQTMEIHHTKHHQAYVDNLNKALEGYGDYKSRTLHDLLTGIATLPEGLQNAVRNQGGGHENHSMFWLMMKKNGGGMPQGNLAKDIEKKFGSFTQFQDLFNAAAKSRFGSGWAWLVVNNIGDLAISSTANQDSPLMHGEYPILGLDVWEHAYYLKYQWRRPDYINAWWNVINWETVYENYEKFGGKV